ncbi:MAG: hypothetical protein ACRCTZ_16130 [Sarcina sp.]
MDKVTLIFPNHLGARVKECIEGENFIEACQYCRQIIWKDTVLKHAPYYNETQTIWDFEPNIRFEFYLDGWRVSKNG